jgi:hypothetical protein
MVYLALTPAEAFMLRAVSEGRRDADEARVPEAADEAEKRLLDDSVRFWSQVCDKVEKSIENEERMVRVPF